MDVCLYVHGVGMVYIMTVCCRCVDMLCVCMV